MLFNLGCGDPVEIDLTMFRDADVVIALSGNRYVDYSAKPGVDISSAESSSGDSVAVPPGGIVVMYCRNGDSELYKGYLGDFPAERVMVVDFSTVLPQCLHGEAGVMEALDAVVAEAWK